MLSGIEKVDFFIYRMFIRREDVDYYIYTNTLIHTLIYIYIKVKVGWKHTTPSFTATICETWITSAPDNLSHQNHGYRCFFYPD